MISQQLVDVLNEEIRVQAEIITLQEKLLDLESGAK